MRTKLSIIVLLSVYSISLTLVGYGQDTFELRRKAMVDHQIKSRDVSNRTVLKAMMSVERHLFVPEYYKEAAYQDTPLPIGYGQTISQPYIVAYMTEAIKPKPGFKVLEIGTGSGYQAAVLAEIVDTVYTIEIIEALGKATMKRLNNMEYDNVVVKIGDGYVGWQEHAPFDAIVVTAAAQQIPPPLIKQLKKGGKMIIPVDSPSQTQMLMLITKNKNNKMKKEYLFPVRFVPFIRAN